MTRSPADYPRRKATTLAEFFEEPEPPTPTLESAICHAFPDANPKKLERWAQRIGAETSGEAGPLLFAVLLCGAEFRIEHPAASAVLGDLWSWLTGSSGGMEPELAELVIEALRPGLVRALARRGWRRGSQPGRFVRKKGRPPENRGAWVAGALAAAFLRQAGAKKAVSLATDLIGVLLGRRVYSNELYRFLKPLPEEGLHDLAQAVAHEYDHWRRQDGVRDRDWEPDPLNQTAHIAWKQRHEALRHVLQDFPGGQLADMALGRILAELWEPLWGPVWGGGNGLPLPESEAHGNKGS